MTITFGKYAGSTIEAIYQNDQSYVQWLFTSYQYGDNADADVVAEAKRVWGLHRDERKAAGTQKRKFMAVVGTYNVDDEINEGEAVEGLGKSWSMSTADDRINTVVGDWNEWDDAVRVQYVYCVKRG